MLLQGGGTGTLDVAVVLLVVVVVVAAILLTGRLFDAAMGWGEPLDDDWEAEEAADDDPDDADR